MLVQVLFIQWSITPLHLLLVYMSTLGSQIPLSALMCFIWFGKWGFPDSSAGKESSCNERNPGLISGSGRSSGEGIGYWLQYSWASLVAQMIKNLPAMQETWVPWVGKISWRRAWQPTPVFLPGESPWTEEPSGVQPTGSQRVGHDWVAKHSRVIDEAEPCGSSEVIFKYQKHYYLHSSGLDGGCVKAQNSFGEAETGGNISGGGK